MTNMRLDETLFGLKEVFRLSFSLGDLEFMVEEIIKYVRYVSCRLQSRLGYILIDMRLVRGWRDET
jgi:hypothetical protein